MNNLNKKITKGELLDIMKRREEEELAGRRVVGLGMICVLATLSLVTWFCVG